MRSQVRNFTSSRDVGRRVHQQDEVTYLYSVNNVSICEVQASFLYLLSRHHHSTILRILFPCCLWYCFIFVATFPPLIVHFHYIISSVLLQYSTLYASQSFSIHHSHNTSTLPPRITSKHRSHYFLFLFFSVTAHKKESL